MNPITLNRAIVEAKRFLACAEACQKEHGANSAGHEPQEKTFYLHSTGRVNGLVRRASMDLTRTLADLRKSG